MSEPMKPMEIEQRSFEIITELLGDRVLDPENELVIKRVIHTTADFDYADNLTFSDHAVRKGIAALKGGCDIVTDTQMAKAGINKTILASLGGEVHCFMSDPDVAQEARSRGVTRAFVTQEMGRGTVTVRFMMDGTYPDGVPKDGDRQAVAAHIETVRPVTADVYVVLPVADPLNLRLRITPDTAAIRLAAEANLWAAVRRDAVPGGTVFLSHLHEALSLTEKEEDHVILSPTANVTPETGHIVVPGSIEWVTE